MWGTGKVRILPDDPSPLVVTSDIDLTFLATRFQGTRDKISLLGMTAAERKAFPGAPELYRALTSRGGSLVLASGSPTFFKETLEACFKSHKIPVHGLYLKDMKGSLKRLRLTSLSRQIDHKLEILFTAREKYPPSTREILLGDDSEADFVAYHLYRRWMSGDFESIQALAAALDALGLSSRVQERITSLAGKVDPRPGDPPVLLILIRRTGEENEDHHFEDYGDDDHLLVDSSLHEALILLDRGILQKPDVLEVHRATSGTDDRALDDALETLQRSGAIDGGTVSLFAD